MALSSDITALFAKTVVSEEKKQQDNSVAVLNGTIVNDSGNKYVRIDGSDQLTPVTTTSNIKHGQRVTVMIKNHSAIITGNLSAPSANQGDLDDIGDQITEMGTLIADKASIKDLEAVNANVENLVADNVVIKDKLTANEASIRDLEAKNVTITGKLDAAEADIDKLHAEKLDVAVADIKFATIENLEATNADIHNLTADFGSFKDLTTDKITAAEGKIEKLEAGQLTVEQLEGKFANIDFANIGKLAIENFFAKSGMIGDLVVGEGTVTGTLVGVTIKGDLIEGGTVKADKLVIKGEDGLYYKLNTNGETVETEQTDQNSLNGSIITAKSITATKISVSDLVAFGATIGGYKIGEHKLYSGVKETPTNTTRGVYMDDEGQFALGDSANFLRFFQDTDGKYKLELAASAIKFGTSGKDLEETIESIDTSAIDIGGRNYLMYTSSLEFDNEIEKNQNGLSSYLDSSKLADDQLGVKYTYTGQTDNDGLCIPLAFEGCISETTKLTLSFRYRGTITDPGKFVFLQKTGDVLPSATLGKELVVSETDWQDYECTFDIINPNPGNCYMLLFLCDDGTKYQSTDWIEIKRKSLKLETGTTATDWSPSPEEVYGDTISVKTEIEHNYKTEIQNTQGQIMQTVSDNYTAKNEFEEYKGIAETQFTQTPESFDFLFKQSQANKDLQDAIGNTDEKVAEFSKYIRFVDGDIVLGEDGNSIVLKIENDRISFLQNNSEVAYMTNNQFQITNAKVGTRLDLGKFSFNPRSNGNLTFNYNG